MGPAHQGGLLETIPRPTIRIGPAGWSYPDWRGIVYPQRQPHDFHAAAYLADYFDTIEINVTFYRPVTASTAHGWIEHVAHNPRFIFTAKLWQKLTHERKLCAANEREFRPALEALRDAGKLGALLAQFPWSFKNTPENREYLIKLADSFGDFPLVVEVRHASWDKKDFYSWLVERGIGFCNLDQPVIGKSIKPAERVTAPVGYVRLHGRNYEAWFREVEGTGSAAERYNYLYSVEELKPWAERVRNVADKTESLFVILNNHFRGKSIANAAQLVHILTRQPVKVPRDMFRHYPELRAIASLPDEEQSLFS